MKKLSTLILVLLASMQIASSQVSRFTATEFAYKFYNHQYEYWPDWSDWEDCKILVVVNLNTEIVTIYSSEVQEYDIYDVSDPKNDRDGGETLKMSCVDSDGIRCEIRFRIQQDSQAQLYVDYADASWVYNITPRD